MQLSKFYLIFSRAPDTAKTMIKVPHAATKESLKKALSTVLRSRLAMPEADFSTVLEKIRKD